MSQRFRLVWKGYVAQKMPWIWPLSISLLTSEGSTNSRRAAWLHRCVDFCSEFSRVCPFGGRNSVNIR